MLKSFGENLFTYVFIYGDFWLNTGKTGAAKLMDFRFILKRVNEVTNYNLMQYYDVMSRQAMRTVKKIYYLKKL